MDALSSTIPKKDGISPPSRTLKVWETSGFMKRAERCLNFVEMEKRRTTSWFKWKMIVLILLCFGGKPAKSHSWDTCPCYDIESRTSRCQSNSVRGFGMLSYQTRKWGWLSFFEILLKLPSRSNEVACQVKIRQVRTIKSNPTVKSTKGVLFSFTSKRTE